jgi:hypothetical protein
VPEFTTTSLPERIGKSTGGKMPAAKPRKALAPARKKAKRVGLINQAVR